MAGDPPTPDTSLQVMRGHAGGGGSTSSELGLPFTDPMADGPTIQLAGQRALEAGQTLDKTLAMARAFREGDDTTPIVLMGYYNPNLFQGGRALSRRGEGGGHRRSHHRRPAPRGRQRTSAFRRRRRASISFRLATPTTDDARLPKVMTKNSSGFVYYVLDHRHHLLGGSPRRPTSLPEVARIKAASDLPCGSSASASRPPEAAEAIAGVADGAVVGSAIVERIGRGDTRRGEVLTFVKTLADGRPPGVTSLPHPGQRCVSR